MVSRYIAGMLVWWLVLSGLSVGQIELSYVAAKSLVGATSPEIIGDRIIIGDDSKPQISPVAIIKVASTEKVRLRARKSLREAAELVKLSEATDDKTKITTAKYMLAGEGSYLVEAMTFSWDRSIDVEIGKSPNPTPDPPEPDPPKPDPPIPDPSVNSFRVIFVKESGSTLTAEQTAIPQAKAIRDYLTTKTTPEGGLAGWREYDPQQSTANEQAKMRDLWTSTKSAITAIPCMVIEVNGKATIVPYPRNAAEALATLKTYGGN